jgi:hypothetical protein
MLEGGLDRRIETERLKQPAAGEPMMPRAPSLSSEALRGVFRRAEVVPSCLAWAFVDEVVPWGGSEAICVMAHRASRPGRRRVVTSSTPIDLDGAMRGGSWRRTVDGGGQ